MKKFHHIWLVFAAYGVWFAILSGSEEISHGKYWKAILALVLGFLSYLILEVKFKNKH
jgi:hypothetical protein